MVKIRFLAVATMCAIMALVAIMPQNSPTTKVSAATVPEVGPGFVLPGATTSSNNAGKYPSVASVGNSVHMVANPDQKAQYWTKLDTASSATGPTNFGSTKGGTDYTPAAIASGPDGMLYAAWIVQNSGIQLKRKPLGGDWEPSRAIYSTGSFMAYLDIAVSSTGQIFIVWNQDFLYRYNTSTDGGATWSGSRVLSSKTPYKPVFIASGGNNITAAAFGGNDAHAYVSIWNGSTFVTTDITPFRVAGEFFAFAKPAVAPNGKIYVAFSRVTGGVYYTEQQPDGSWPVSRLAGGKVYGAMGIALDSQNNIHLSWAGDASGIWELYYAFKPVTGDWQGPIKATGINDRIVVDIDSATTSGARAYSHNILEAFTGSQSSVRYQQFSGEGGSGASATPSLDGGAIATRNSVVTVNFSNVTGSPDGVRYHWDAAPTDADPWVAFTNPLINVPGPTGVTTDACQTHTLYTQVRKGTTAGSVAQDSEIFDIGVQASVNILNRHLTGLPTVYGLNVQDVYTGPGGNGASDGDPNYTRERSFFLGINGNADCSGLSTFNVTGSDNGPITNNIYANTPALPGGIAFGPHDINVEVKDKLGNTTTEQKTLIYDPANTDATGTQTNTLGLPVLGSGGSVTADNANSIIQSLSFQGISVTDNLYGQQPNLPQLAAGKQFWGVWIANTTSPSTTVDSANLNWYPVRVPTPDSSFTVKWNLFTGLGFTTDLRNKPGDYYVFVRFLDGAGNASTESLPRLKVTLEAGYDIPTMRLPAVAR
jgi:hypothetical protein